MNEYGSETLLLTTDCNPSQNELEPYFWNIFISFQKVKKKHSTARIVALQTWQ
jgi:hypothetical protein